MLLSDFRDLNLLVLNFCVSSGLFLFVGWLHLLYVRGLRIGIGFFVVVFLRDGLALGLLHYWLLLHLHCLASHLHSHEP